MHISKITYERTFRLEKYLGESFKFETLKLGCEVELDNGDNPDTAYSLAKFAVKEQFKEALKTAREKQEKQGDR